MKLARPSGVCIPTKEPYTKCRLLDYIVIEGTMAIRCMCNASSNFNASSSYNSTTIFRLEGLESWEELMSTLNLSSTTLTSKTTL